MDILFQDFLRRFWRELIPLLDWAVKNWSVILLSSRWRSSGVIARNRRLR
jgi:hypothetical protein